MYWLRSEDLKEEKEVTAPTVIIALLSLLCGFPRPQPTRQPSVRKMEIRFGQKEKADCNERPASILLTTESSPPTLSR